MAFGDAGEVYPPADHPLVVAVGDTAPDSSLGPTADGRLKPDVVVEDSRAFFTDGEISSGSSNAAAYVAGCVALLRAAEPGLRARHLLWLIRLDPAVPRSRVRPSVSSPRPAGARPAPPTPQELRVWKTPSRARLAQVVRDGR